MADEPPPPYPGDVKAPPPQPHYPNLATAPPDAYTHTNTTVVMQPPQIMAAAPAIVIAAGNCPHCRVGSIMDQQNVCCLVCLIVLCIFTFPFGLLFLCCIPCANDRRCTHCGRQCA